MKSIAQIIHHNTFPLIFLDSKGNELYYESCYEIWWRYKYDDNGNGIYGENSNGYWRKSEYDDNNNELYCVTSTTT